MKMHDSLVDWRYTIAKEAPRVGKAPYSHNIIGIALSAIAEKFGAEEAEKAIIDFKLDKKGWNKKAV